MLRILIADDHPVLMQALTRIIHEEFPGVYVEGATDTTILITKVESEAWDLVISDLAMPGGGGFFALKKIKAINHQLPVLILSTYPREQYEPRVIKAGAESFVSKDSLPGGLIKAVRRILGSTTPNPEQ
jgi:DNA-binding NarL/FixJ family response regulator